MWVIGASNADLATLVRERRFREDLYHRLAVVTFWLPALRDRGQTVDRGGNARIGQDRGCQRILVRTALAVVVGQLQELAVQAPVQLACDIGIEERRAAAQPARRPSRAEPAQHCRAQLHAEVRHDQ